MQVPIIKVKKITDVFYLLYTYNTNNNSYSKQNIVHLINVVDYNLRVLFLELLILNINISV